MSELSHNEYWTEINSLAENMVSECMDECDNDREASEELINDSRLHETIDGHQWVIYYAYNDDVIKHSDNDEYYTDIYGKEDIGTIVSEQGLDSFKTIVAFWAMYADVQDKLSDAFDEYENQLEVA